MAEVTNNRLLRALSRETRTAVLERCARVEIPGRVMLAEAGEPMPAVHFPETMVVSSLATYGDGSTIEMANIGREACTAIGPTLGRDRALSALQTRIGGAALELPLGAFYALKEARPDFEAALFASLQAMFHQVMVSAACNGAHDAKRRLARWLLTMADRTDGETMRLTHDFLAEMLCVRRATVTGAAMDLRDAGLIDYGRGRVTITDRDGLRRASCECYAMVRETQDALLPPNVADA